MRQLVICFSLLAVAWASPAGAQTAINQTHPLARGGRIDVDNLAGQVRVRGWDRDEVAVTGTLGANQRLEVNDSPDRLQLEVIYPRNSRNSEGTRLELRIPRGASLQVEAVSGDVDVDQVELARVQLKSVSGAVTAAGRAKEAQLETVSGALRSTLASSRLTLDTVSGAIEAPAGASGQISVESVSGQIRLEAGQVSRLQAQSVSGATTLRIGALAPGGSVSAESVSGSIRLALPRTSSAALSIETFSGGIQSSVGRVEQPEYGPGKSLKASLGSGNGDVKLESHSGSVQVVTE
ncbi:DUF4097 family beta strand repeat-containing protein [Xanthomonas maliensis]|uniref:DUF4097 family beta strand repeat-containing protein n=1 Tax=Xanthomonas maliensis TaxID=1321368 RepID=UPI00039E87E8|nr:DUF4097 family beta strand repeat-containing protein [Xanthomonas maliensis]KAB7763823.1 hypothetical protein CKY51_18910 [Xanthomonas maliensis]